MINTMLMDILIIDFNIIRIIHKEIYKVMAYTEKPK